MYKGKLLSVAVLLAALSAPAALGDIVVYVEPNPGLVPLGGTATVSIYADIAPENPVAAWGLDLDVDDLTVAAPTDPPSIGPLWLSDGQAPDGDFLAGFAFPESISGEDVLLATIEFTGLSDGTTTISPGVTPGDLTEGFVMEGGAFVDEVSFVPGTIIVPEPTTLGLLALGGLMLLRHRASHESASASIRYRWAITDCPQWIR